eukprot:759462-Hanusia_phi.AAC.2
MPEVHPHQAPCPTMVSVINKVTHPEPQIECEGEVIWVENRDRVVVSLGRGYILCNDVVDWTTAVGVYDILTDHSGLHTLVGQKDYSSLRCEQSSSHPLPECHPDCLPDPLP